jgi:hypothetical protein
MYNFFCVLLLTRDLPVASQRFGFSIDANKISYNTLFYTNLVFLPVSHLVIRPCQSPIWCFSHARFQLVLFACAIFTSNILPMPVRPCPFPLWYFFPCPLLIWYFACFSHLGFRPCPFPIWYYLPVPFSHLIFSPCPFAHSRLPSGILPMPLLIWYFACSHTNLVFLPASHLVARFPSAADVGC